MKKTVLYGLIFIASISLAHAAQIDKTTHLFAIKDSDTLHLDRYALAGGEGQRPCVMFAFGGGFTSGERDKEMYKSYFEFLAREGYVVVSIDYRVGFRGLEEGKGGVKKLITVFQQTIDRAVEDLFDATSYLVDNAARMGIDPSAIVVSGSSAGAVTALQGEYYICNRRELSARLPEGFNYAGVISFAGAVFEMKRKLVWDQRPCPVLMFHGDADSNVPYGRLRKLWIGFYGSEYIAGQLSKTITPYWFYSFPGAAHEIAVDPMTDNHAQIKEFLDRLVFGHEAAQITTSEGLAGRPHKKHRFGVMDYVRANFGG